MSHQYIEFAQDQHFVVMISEKHPQPPVLSKEALTELDLARHNAVRDGWGTCFDYKVKKALIQEYLLKQLISTSKDRGSYASLKHEEAVWEVIHFVDFWVYDVYPFRDNRPE